MIDAYQFVGPVLRALDPETAHHLTLRLLKTGLVPARTPVADPALELKLWGLGFANPVGLAAGFDKNAEVAPAMLGQGFGFVEVGTVTPRPQAGNPKPRIFRLPEDQALINRLGFNNEGLDRVAARLEAYRNSRRPGIVGVNVGPNRDSADPTADCAAAVLRIAGLADYLVVNVSSPNTPGLRRLQAAASLRTLLAAVLTARDRAGAATPVLVKIAPDLTADDCRDIAEVVLAAGADGLVATNTTVDRPPSLVGRHRHEDGGLSGRPLFERSTEVLRDMYRLTEGRLPIVGVGGVASGRDAYLKIRAGASLVQLYTALVYQGPGLIGRINRELLDLLRRDGFSRLADAIGADHRGAAGLRPGTAP